MNRLMDEERERVEKSVEMKLESARERERYEPQKRYIDVRMERWREGEEG